MSESRAKAPNTRSSAFNPSSCESIDFETVFKVVYAPDSWSCASTGTTNDVFLLLGSGKVLGRRLAIAAAADEQCPLLLEINGTHKVLFVIAGGVDDVTVGAAGACPPLRAARKGLAAMQPHNRVPPSSAAARWARLRALVHFMTLPCFSSAARRQRQAEALHCTAVHRMRNLLLHKAFAGWRSSHTAASAALPLATATSTRIGLRQCGLRNLGNTCYLNATLQCILHTPSLRGALAAAAGAVHPTPARVAGQRRLLGQPPSDAPPCPELQACLGGLCRQWEGSPAPSLLVPQDILEALWRAHPQFVGFCQQDAQELLCALVGSLGGGHGDGDPPPESPAALFQHTTVQHTICGACGHTSERQQQCAAPITVSVPPSAVSFKAPGRSSSAAGRGGGAQKQAQARLPDMLQQELFSTEFVDGMQCDACGQRARGQRRVALAAPPRLMAVHVNRTSWAHGGRKVQTCVETPVQLHLPSSGAAGQSVSYALLGMVIHHGRSLSCGHYTACARSLDVEGQSTWLLLNDDRVSRISVEEALSQQAYLCFYERV